ncbi:MAG: carbon monoxide dehydrogenase [Proteobacteria bacterium]|jgi:Uncharacterized conserved protein|nr:MAG: carbon monoxide dehydrogenase [Pseudomonadota bacterium]
MRLADAQWIPAPPHQTWQALNDPEVLQRCIPGCVQVRRHSPTEYELTVRTRVAGIESEYQGELLLSDVQAPSTCTLAFEGKGQAAGLVIGTAQVNLAPKDDGTRLSYTVAAHVGGKLAEIGEPAILKAAGHIVEKFFAAFIDYAAKLPPAPPPPAEQPESRRSLRESPLSWLVFAGVLLAFFLYHGFVKS